MPPGQLTLVALPGMVTDDTWMSPVPTPTEPDRRSALPLVRNSKLTMVPAVIDVSGVGYLVFCSARTLAHLGLRGDRRPHRCLLRRRRRLRRRPLRR